ncbi:MAG: hypothetical protein GXP53_03650 [Deltaproteobacteria bacterium]|nr:hypothetical protein [Deltaproteobacteria bacterium]
MDKTFSDDIRQDLSDYINQYTGLYFPENKHRSLMKGITSAAEALGFEKTDEFIDWLTKGPPSAQTIDALVRFLTIGETYFFRDKNMFQTLKDEIFRGLLTHPRKNKKHINIWSAGCASGEEPYSIAILIDQMASAFRGWTVSIIGTDINTEVLEKARKGVYTSWSFRDTPNVILKKYFISRNNNTFEVKPEIKKRVNFSRLNLMQSDYTGVLNDFLPVDVVLCRNVIMYFKPGTREQVFARIGRFLDRDGWLISSPAESGFVSSAGLATVRFQNAICHRKGLPRKSETEKVSRKCSLKPKAGGRVSTAVKSLQSIIPASFRRKTDRRNAIVDPQIIFHQASLLYQAGQYMEVINRLTPLFSGRPTDGTQFLMAPESMALLARTHANLGDLDQAESWCKKAIEHERLNPEHHYLHGIVCQEDGRLADAIKAFKHAIYLDPNQVMGHFTLSLIMKHAGRPSDGRRHLKITHSLLSKIDTDEIIPLSDGLTAGRLMETVSTLLENGRNHE